MAVAMGHDDAASRAREAADRGSAAASARTRGRWRIGCGLLGACLAVGAACSAEEGATADGDKVAAPVLRAGPCDAALRYPDGREVADFLRWTYDAGGRALTEKRHDLTTDTGFDTWSKEWTYDQSGWLQREVYVTSDDDEANHDWVWTRDPKGAPLTRVGSTSSYDRESCAFEYSQSAAKPDDFRIFCTFEVDKKDKTGAIVKVVKGSHAEDHTFHNDLPGKAYGEAGAVRREVVLYSDGIGGTPAAEVSFVHNGKGLLIARERDKALQGYPDQVTRWSYDGAGRRVREDADDDGDGKVDHRTQWTYDAAGNLSQADFDLGADAAIEHRWLYGYGCW